MNDMHSFESSTGLIYCFFLSEDPSGYWKYYVDVDVFDKSKIIYSYAGVYEGVLEEKEFEKEFKDYLKKFVKNIAFI